MTVSESLGEGTHRWAAALYRLTSFWRAAGLTVMWLVACLPVVTAGAATVALLAVVRDDVRGRERPVLRSYLHYLRENFRVGTVLLVAAVAPVSAMSMLWHPGPSPLLWSVWVLALVGTAAAVPLIVHGFPLAAHTTHASVRALHRATVLLTLSRPGATLVGLMLIGICAVAVTVWPGTLLILAYPAARGLFVTFRSAFEATAREQRRRLDHGAA